MNASEWLYAINEFSAIYLFAIAVGIIIWLNRDGLRGTARTAIRLGRRWHG